MEKIYNIIIHDNADNSRRLHVTTSESDLFQYIGTMLSPSEEVKAVISVGSDGMVYHEEVKFAGRFDLDNRVIYNIKNPDITVAKISNDISLEDYLINDQNPDVYLTNGPALVDTSEQGFPEIMEDQSIESEPGYPIEDEDFNSHYRPEEEDNNSEVFRNKWS
jgi:hypothetical protein